jgi:hypothetical protein
VGLGAELERRFDVEPRVYDEPFETSDGTTVVPVARIGWWGRATPVGVFVIREDTTTWVPAVDHTRIALLGAFIGLVAATISTIAVVRRPPWPDVRIHRR